MSEVIDPGAHWEITRANNAGQKPNSHGGTLDKWYVGLKNLDGRKDCDDAYWQRKAPSEVSIGDKVYGKLEKGEFGFRFYLEKEPDGGGSFEAQTGSAGGSNAKGNWQPESERDPERAARILRQHSQEMAIRFAALVGPEHLDLTRIFEFADQFDQDVIQAGQAVNSTQGPPPAQAGASSSQSASPGSSSPPADEAEFFSKLLQDAAMDAAAANELGKFMSAKFSIEQKQKAQRELGETQAQGDCIGRLRAAYEQSTSKVLPVTTDDTDIPF